MNINKFTTLFVLCFLSCFGSKSYAQDPLVISIEEYYYYYFGQVGVAKEVIVNVTSGTVDLPNGWSYTGTGCNFDVLEKTGTKLRLGVTANTADFYTIQIDAHSTLNGDDSDSFILRVADISVSCPSYKAYHTVMDILYSIDAPGSVQMPIVYVLDTERDTMFLHVVASEEGEDITYSWDGKGSASGPYSGVYLPLGTYIAGFVACAGFRAEQEFTIIVKITEPDGDPAYDHQFSFNDASPGVCTIGAEGTTGYTALDDDLEWDITTITGSTLTSNPNPPEGDSVTFTYTGLPSSNSGFGPKTLALELSDTEIIDTIDVEIFFEQDPKNHPGEGAGTTPNWFYYWGEENGAVPEIYYEGFQYYDLPLCGFYNGNLYLCQYANFPSTLTDTWYNCYYQTSVHTGIDGICDTTSKGDDSQLIYTNCGEANANAIYNGGDGFHTTPQGDDSIIGQYITTGTNGKCETTPSGNDTYVYYGTIQMALTHGKPYTTCITAGNDGWLDSEVGHEDVDYPHGLIMPVYGGNEDGKDELDLTNATTVSWSIDATSLEMCAITCTHELKHKEIHQVWYGDQNNDGDGVPDSYETGFRIDGEDPKLDPYHNKTYVSFYYDSEWGYMLNKGLVNDNEFICYMTQHSGSADPSQDWSENGSQWHTGE